MPNFLEQLTQSGALNVPNPMERYKNVLAIKKFQMEMEGAPLEKRAKELDIESKVLTIGKSYLARVKDRSEYPQYRTYMVDTLGANPALFPESFESDEAFEDYRTQATASADELLKMRQGKPFTVSIPMLTGQYREVEVKNQEDLKQRQDNGLIPANAVIGKVTGTATKEKTMAERTAEAYTAREEERLESEPFTPSSPEALENEALIQGSQAQLREEAKVKEKPEKEKESALQEKINTIAKAHPDWTYQKIVDEAANVKPEKLEPAQNYLLPDNSIVRSFDGGRTYEEADGRTHSMPYTAVKITATVTGEELGMIKAKGAVEKETKIATGLLETKTAEEAAKGGTGPYRKLAAVIDNVLGGVGVDIIFGKEGIFPDTQENRQILRTIKQTGKMALMTSSRGAIYEQKIIDTLFPDPDKTWRNPRIEANKFKVLRQTLITEREFNNRAIQTAVSPKEVSDLRKSNTEIDRLLALMGQGQPKQGISPLTEDDESLIRKYLPK